MKSIPPIKAGLLRHSLEDQVLVYDPQKDCVHLLDQTTGCVLELLQERGWTPEGIVAELGSRLHVAANPEIVQLAVDQLRAVDLLDEPAPRPLPMTDSTRREMVRKLALTGVTALLIPAIATLAAKPAYAAGTLGAGGAGCTVAGDCSSNVCCGGLCQSVSCQGNGGSSTCTTATRYTCCSCTCGSNLKCVA